MKYILFISSFIISSYSNAQYIPMLEEGNSWSVDVYYEPFDPPEPPYSWIETEQITLGDLEEFNGMDYFRVYSGDQATCLLREENGIVYKYDEYEEIDKILFDFTLEEGDTFNLLDSAYDSYFDYCTIIGGQLFENQLTVDTVEEIIIAGESRKVITFLEYGGFFIPFQWIEGIGNNSGFDNLWEQLDITGGTLLVCFTSNDTTFFFNDAISCDNTTLSIHETSNNIVSLYPNPVSNKSILQLPSEGYADTIKIFDFQGKLLKEESINSDFTPIDATKYPSGFYFYQLFNKNKLLNVATFIVK